MPQDAPGAELVGGVGFGSAAGGVAAADALDALRFGNEDAAELLAMPFGRFLAHVVYEPR